MKQAMLKRTLSLLLTAAILLTAAGCSKVSRADSSIKMTGMYFDTVISCLLYTSYLLFPRRSFRIQHFPTLFRYTAVSSILITNSLFQIFQRPASEFIQSLHWQKYRAVRCNFQGFENKFSISGLHKLCLLYTSRCV